MVQLATPEALVDAWQAFWPWIENTIVCPDIAARVSVRVSVAENG